MKAKDSDFIVSRLIYGMAALLIGIMLYEIGYIKGLTHAYKTGLQKQIEMLEEKKQESMIRQILNKNQ